MQYEASFMLVRYVIDMSLCCCCRCCAQVLFATDMLPEAQAAQAAGWQAVLVVRPGNKPLPDNHGFRVVESMQELLKL
jgi:methionine salvage enolase-phosphatase E1